jgi:hypothetical protein
MAVWKRLKAALTDSQTLRETFRSTLAELKQKRGEMGKATESIDRELENISGKKERLGLAYADGAVAKEAYDNKLGIIKKREGELLAARSNLNPQVGMELDKLEEQIAMLEHTVDGKPGSRVLLTEFGAWALELPEDTAFTGPLSLAAGGNFFEDSFLDPPGFFRIGGTLYRIEDSLLPAMEFPREEVRQNIRRTLEGLGIKVHVFRDRVEIRGFIPTEVMDIPGESGYAMGGPIISSARGSGGWVSNSYNGGAYAEKRRYGI